MTKQDIRNQLLKIYNETPGNIIDAEHADYPEVVNLKIYDEPLIGFGAADDALFEKYKEPGIVGPWYLGPGVWMISAQTVISVFMPFSKRVKESNALMTEFGSPEWAYGRVEGQLFINACMAALAEWFKECGEEAVMPAGDPRFFTIVNGKKKGAAATSQSSSNFYPGADATTFSSTWSERHAAFVCGLGTFGMSRGMITAKGIAGRFGSIIVSTKIEADVRPYKDIYEYCIKCGKCADRCPAKAFPVRGELKDHRICEPHVGKSAQILKPRYGCGLCQVGTPCQDGIPKKA